MEIRLNLLKQLNKHLNNFLDASMDMSKLRILTEAYFDETFLKESVKFYKKLKNYDLNSLDKLFKSAFEKTNEYLAICKTDNFETYFINFNKAQAYFSMLESVIEDSKIVNGVIENIKNTYSNYLEIIQKYDKEYLSLEHTQSDYSIYLKNDIEFANSNKMDENLKLYILLKRWQDITHYYYLENFKNQNIELNKKYLNTEVDHFSNNFKTISKRITESFSSKYELSEFVDAYYCNFNDELMNYIGGKTFGLLKLLALNIEIPKTYVVSHLTNLDNILSVIKNKKTKYAIRSSANIEDGKNNSFAGLFDSFLNVSYDHIVENIIKVRNSVSNERVLEYITHNSLEEPKMNVIVQEYINPDYAGVWLGNKRNGGLLEWVKGSGENLVLGKVVPKHEHFDGGNKESSIKINDQSVASLLNDLQNKILKQEKVLCDFEWCVKNNKLYLLQFRPVTRIIKTKKVSIENSDENLIYGTPASAGKKVGKIKYIRLYSNEAEIADDEVLLTFFTDPEWLPLMKKTSCIVTAMGGFLSHTAILARELGITCVTGIGVKNFKKLINCKEIEVDGVSGSIKIIS